MSKGKTSRTGGRSSGGHGRSAGAPTAAAAPAAVPAAAALPRFQSLPLAGKALVVLLWLLVLLPPWWISEAAKESFRLPKQMVAGWLALATLLPLAWELRRVEVVRFAAVWRLPAVRAVVPLLTLATLSAATTAHPLHVRDALADLWIGGACLAGWSAAVPERRLARMLGALVVPGVALAAYGILQFHGAAAAGIGAGGPARLAIVSRAGNPGDLAAFLVLPCLAAQWRLARAAPGRRWLWIAALAVCTYGLAITQTVAALAALLLGSLLFWGRVMGRGAAGRRHLAWTAAALVALTFAAGLGAAAVPALRARMQEKAAAARQGDWNDVLTGRLDGWRTAAWMLSRHPLAGVGHGAFRAEFAPAKLALLDRGAPFYAGQQQSFVNAHDEVLEVGADLGWPGLCALGWGLWVLAAALRARLRRDADTALPAGATAGAAGADGGLALAGVAALAVLSLVDFPFRIALVAYPALLFLAWLAAGASGGGAGADDEAAAELGGAGGGGVKGRGLAWGLVAVLAAALVAQSLRWHDRMLASKLVNQVEIVAVAVAGANPAGVAGLLPDSLASLRQAAAADRLNVEVPLARGSLLLLARRPQEAIDAYQAALALEPHAEILRNLGDAQLAAGRAGEAHASYRDAVRLSPWLRNQVPAGEP